MYMVSVRYSATNKAVIQYTVYRVIQAFIYSVKTIWYRQADVVSIMSQGPSILAEWQNKILHTYIQKYI